MPSKLLQHILASKLFYLYNYASERLTNEEAIIKALQPGVSRTFNNSFDDEIFAGTAIRIQFKISGLSKIKDILTEIDEEGKHDRDDGFKTASKASQFDFLD